MHCQAPVTTAPVSGEPGATRVWPTAVALVLLSGGLLAASWLQPDPARNDFERFGDLRLSFLFFVLVAALCATYLAAYAQRQAVSTGTLVVVTGMCTALLFASFPVGSKDVFGYAFLGRMWGTHHANPYVVPPTAFTGDAWQPVLAGTLGRTLSVYGPLFMWQSWLVNAAAGESIWVAVWLHKVCAAAFFIGTLWLARALLRDLPETNGRAPASWLLLLVAWNPLFAFEAAGAAHNDIAMVCLLVGALHCWRSGRGNMALALLALSFWYKLYSVIFIPLFLLETLKASGVRAATRQAGVCAAVAIVCGVVLLSPLPGALEAIIGGMLHPEKMRGIFPNELSPPLAALFWAVRLTGLFDTDFGFRIFDLSRFTLFAGAVVGILSRQWRAVPSFDALAESCCLTGLAFFMLLITQLWPWHLLSVIAFGVLCRREPLLLGAVVLTILGLLSYFLTFAVATVMLGLAVGAVGLVRRLDSARAVRGHD